MKTVYPSASCIRVTSGWGKIDDRHSAVKLQETRVINQLQLLSNNETKLFFFLTWIPKHSGLTKPSKGPHLDEQWLPNCDKHNYWKFDALCWWRRQRHQWGDKDIRMIEFHPAWPKGDSGGPLTVEKDGAHILEGVTSHGLSKIHHIKVHLKRTKTHTREKEIYTFIHLSHRTALMCTPESLITSPGSTLQSLPMEVFPPVTTPLLLNQL